MLGLRPDQVMMCAAHKGDLKASQRAGMATAYVPIATESGDGRETDMTPDPSFTVNATDFPDLATQLLA